MNAFSPKNQKDKSQAIPHDLSINQNRNESSVQLVDNSLQTNVQRDFQQIANNSPQVKQLEVIQRMADSRMGSYSGSLQEGSGQGINSEIGHVTQLKVKKYAASRWYSTFDPYTEFWTKAEATKHDKKLRGLGRSELSARVPTLYTYTHTKPHNKISSIPQGPHTVAHRVTLSTLTSITTMAEIQSVFDEQVVNASEVEDFLNKDELPPSGAFSKQIQARIDRFVDDYEEIHDNLMIELSKKSGDVISAKHMLNQLLNMDPYAVYAWKTTTAASKASLKGKSESVQNPTFSDMYDKPPSSSFRSQPNLDSFVDHREDLFDTYMQ